MTIITNKSYRKDYCSYLGYDITECYHVHHIDHDRENNKINNLVAIPKTLHSLYHKLHKRLVSHEYYYKSMLTDGVRSDMSLIEASMFIKPYFDCVTKAKLELVKVVVQINRVKQIQDSKAVNRIFA